MFGEGSGVLRNVNERGRWTRFISKRERWMSVEKVAKDVGGWVVSGGRGGVCQGIYIHASSKGRVTRTFAVGKGVLVFSLSRLMTNNIS